MNKVYKNLIFILLKISLLLSILAIIGVSIIAPEYLENLRTILKLIIGFILVGLYNPITYKKQEFTEFDRNIVFSAGVFLLLSTTIISGIEEYFKMRSKRVVAYYKNIYFLKE